MGCDIHSAVEVRRDGKWAWDKTAKFPDEYNDDKFTNEPFDWRNYGMFGFLADVRNYSHVPTIAEPRGLPDDLSEELQADDGHWLGDHSFSWLSLKELLDYDYDQVFWDRRVTKEIQLEAAGYVENESVGQRPEWFNTRERMGRYIVGQAINGMRMLGAPHPITIQFCEKYFGLPEGAP